jgi:hypothetical protein
MGDLEQIHSGTGGASGLEQGASIRDRAWESESPNSWLCKDNRGRHAHTCARHTCTAVSHVGRRPQAPPRPLLPQLAGSTGHELWEGTVTFPTVPQSCWHWVLATVPLPNSDSTSSSGQMELQTGGLGDEPGPLVGWNAFLKIN